MRWLYSLAWAPALPFLFLYLLWRARRQPEYRRHWSERLGRGPLRTGRPRILVHAVSVGETRAAVPLVNALLNRHPDHEILLTHTTPTGRAAGRELFGDRVLQAYLPYDFPPLVRLFLHRTQPERCIVMETEIWPNFFLACARRRIPAFLVNARLSERSARGYRRIRRLVSPALRSLAGIAAQTAQDGVRLQALGASGVQVTGNLKFDVTPPADTDRLTEELRGLFRGRFVFLAASTRDGEEAMLLDAMRRPECADILLVLVPRHPQRFEEVARLLEARGLAWERRSRPQAAGSPIDMFLGDSMGEMAAYYAAADLAYVGGSLLPFGGQNLIEAAAAGCPALIGPHTWNFEEAAERAVAEGCALRVDSIDELVAALQTLHDDGPKRLAMAAAGRRFAAANQGATMRVMAMIESGWPGGEPVAGDGPAISAAP
jgi:3-deoxy-D-manno-octulosonic-acid transferase